jgi:hypothetical protein
MSGGGYPKFRNDRGVPEIRIGVKEFMCIGESPPQDHPYGLTLRGYTLFEVVGKPERMAKGKQYVLDGLASGKLKPIIAKTFPLEKIVDAQEQRANRKDVTVN